MSPFDQYVARQDDNLLSLPLVHTTTVEALEGFVATGRLQTRFCEVFANDLIYLFYGRPSFRPRNGCKPSCRIGDLPVCFVFRSSGSVESIRRVYPFDSGAARSNRFLPHIAKEDCGNYELSPTVEAARRTVAAFFRTNEGYYKNNIIDLVTSDADPREVRQYLAMAADGELETADDRRTAIEFQVERDIPLSETVSHIIMPGCVADRTAISDTIFVRWGVTPVTYTWVRFSCPKDYVAVIQDKLWEAFKQEWKNER